MKRLTATALALSALTIVPACSQDAAPALDVPYVPTPQPIVDMMLDMVNLQDGDVVWDLGCGDGRMVITAATRKDIRGVGVDIDPQRIKESKENAKKAGVEDKVDFRVADLFKTDFSDATVLTMYLLETVNRRLRPVILRDLQPGARIVSNTFSMGDWKHDEMKTTEGETFPRNIYHWVVPANITGSWKWTMGDESGVLKIEQNFQEFTGTATMNGESHPVKEGRIKGREISFVIDVPERGDTTHTATADGDQLNGVIDGKKWSAKRDAGTKVVLDKVQEGDN
jgi:hypothetical protein